MKSILLDSSVWLWLLKSPDKIGPHSHALINQSPTVFVSSASSWELNIKHLLGQLHLPGLLSQTIPASNLKALPISIEHTEALPLINLPHKDPFDRLLMAQAKVENLTFLTSDSMLIDQESFCFDART